MSVALSVWKLFVCASLEGVQTASCAAPLTAGGRDDENQFSYVTIIAALLGLCDACWSRSVEATRKD